MLTLPAETLLNARYKIEKVIGRGGFGVTYKAYDQKLNRKVAIKEFFPADFVTRDKKTGKVIPEPSVKYQFDEGVKAFLKEARTLAQIESIHIVRVYEHFEENNTSYLIMNFVNGVTLAQTQADKGAPFSISEFIPIAQQILDGLESIHQHDILHRDIKPQNIMLTEKGNIIYVDFGNARSIENSITQSAFTPRYASPEMNPFQTQIDAKQGTWTDIYALGATFYNLLTGHPPPTDTERLAGVPLHSPKEINQSIERYISESITKAMELSPQSRFQNVSDFREGLRLTQRALLAPTFPIPRFTWFQRFKLWLRSIFSTPTIPPEELAELLFTEASFEDDSEPRPEGFFGILCVEGAFLGEIIPIDSQGLTIGRDPDSSSLIIDDGLISRTHLEIRFSSFDSYPVLIDLNSSNGTWINGHQIQAMQKITLQLGDTISIGSEKNRFELCEKAD